MPQPSARLGFFMSKYFASGKPVWQSVLQAIALVLIIEGVTPFLYPIKWRQLVQQLAMIDNNALRLIGFASMLIGVGLLYLIKDFT